MLGRHYREGIGVSKDFGKAVYWLTKAAEQGNAEAQFALGVCYVNGEGVDINLEKAISLFEKLAKGNANAKNNLNVCQNKLGCFYAQEKEDYEKAVFWFEKAIENGSDAAVNNLKLAKEKLEKSKKKGWFSWL